MLLDSPSWTGTTACPPDFADPQAETGRRLWGHEDAFSPATLSNRFRLGKPTFAGTRGNEQDAPTPDLPALAPRRGCSSSRPEEFHLRALPEPCMTLSSHTAPDVQPLLERLCLVHGLLPFPVGQWPRPNNAAPSPQPHYRAFEATTGCSAPAPRFGTLALAVGAACDLSLGIGEQVLTFRTKAWSSFAPPTCRMPLGPSQASPELIPEEGSPPGFDIV